MLISTGTDTAKQTEATYMVDSQPYKGWEYIGVAPKPGTPGYGLDVAGDDTPLVKDGGRVAAMAPGWHQQ